MKTQKSRYRVCFSDCRMIGRLFLLTTIVCLIAEVSWAGTGTYSGGKGTEAEPYDIGSPADLLELAGTTGDYSEHFILTADIDMAGEGPFDKALIAPDTSDSDNFQGPAFNGVFDGNGHIIRNLVIASNDGSDYIGLFGYAGYYPHSATIRDLGVENILITTEGVGHKSVGGLIGEMYNGQIKRCFSTGAIHVGANGEKIGGLLGYSTSGDVSNSYSQCSVSCGDNGDKIGGLMGGCSNIDCEKNYAAGAVTAGAGSSDVGGFLGGCDGFITTLANFYDINASGQSLGVIAKGLSTVEMSGKRHFLDGGWDFVNETANGENDYWKSPAKHYPILSWQEYRVGIADLRELTNAWLTNSTDPKVVYPVDFWQDGHINMKDFSMLSQSWLSGQMQLGFPAITDGFESGDFSALHWERQGNVLWEIAESSAYEGDYCAYVTGVPSMDVSILNLDVTTGEGKISFYYKLSGGIIYFSIDENVVGPLGPATDWSYAQFEITEGEHTCNWTYFNYFGSAEDDARLDNLRIFGPN
ncbi:MAG: hypothetical protein K9M57_09230 [Phycisphaerae bacterium]|nr:hypothetical protein [Phycisphaerae bacterium]